MKLLFTFCLLVLSFGSFASSDDYHGDAVDLPGGYRWEPHDFEKCSVEPNGCKEVAVWGRYVVVKEPSTTCPAGYFFLLDTVDRVVSFMETVSCDPETSVEFKMLRDKSETVAVVFIKDRPHVMIPLEHHG